MGMEALRKKLGESPEFARAMPLVLFAGLTALQGKLGLFSEFWLYGLKTLMGCWLVWEMRPYVQEMRWKISWEAIAVGIGVFVIWVGLDGHYPRLAKLEADAGWNPLKQFPTQPGIAWFFIVFRIVGSSLVVPPLEEVFYRSFLYRYLVKLDFLAMPLGQFHLLSFVVTSAIFGLMHPDRWVAGILCGLAYQGLAIRKGRLGDSMTAHGITNLVLGVYLVWKGAWSFW